ncbi:cellulose biosynthesis cyclic di-GMP-binding regulatory protein BcsB [Methylomarinum vadi]|uniref:cellulose biosynthesis cyclic di-GMP-binding regulatory protein BcsB n=1 Tax=Methylomarinum vadi TaxID=438855 RepID=UPI0004DFBAC4|nr:cellulose biosynthesis cyclic di-GMP-binding regulatory protein BcsB [Methylomarinum vadi]
MRLLNHGLFALVLCLFPLLAKAITETDVASKTWPINHFMVKNEPILLDYVSNAYRISFPVSERVSPASLELDLLLHNSNRLKSERSQLTIFLNDYPVGQVGLDAKQPQRRINLHIAGEYLVNGYNSLTFSVAQHYTATQCEDWSAPELWTRIDSVRSTLTLNYRNKNVDTSLAFMNELINDRLGDYSISMLRAEDQVSDDYLYWGGLVAQGVKLRLDYVPMTLEEQSVRPFRWPEDQAKDKRFNIDPSLLRHDAVLLGTKAQLREIIAPEVLAAIKGAYIGLFRQDSDKQHFILVISGGTGDQVGLAAKAFALLRSPFPDAASTIIYEQDLPSGDGILPIKTVLPEQTYAFSRFGYRSRVLDSEYSTARLQFDLPADLYSTEEAMVVLHLNLAYGAAMRRDSVINLSLNGLFNHSIWLKEADGAHYRDYQVAIPLRDFKAGLNTLTFAAVLTPSEYGECTYIQRKNLKVTLYEDSSIEFPPAGRAATLPDLALLSSTGYPFVKGGSAGQTVVQLMNSSSDTIRSGWLFLAKLAALAHAPLFDFKITVAKDLPDRKYRIAIGSSNVDADVLKNAPVRLGQSSRFPYPYRERQIKADQAAWTRLLAVISGDDLLPQITAGSPENALVTQSAGLGNQFLLMSYPSADIEEGLVLTILGKTGNALYPGMHTLLSPDVWGQLQKNVFIWNQRKQVYSQWEGDRFVLGDKDLNLNMVKHFSDHPWRWLLLVGVTLLIAAWLLYRLLVLFKRRAHPGVEEDAE